MNKNLWVPVLVIVATYAVFRWDYHVSNYVFESICSDPDKIGLFTYERVELSDEYFEPLPTEWIHHDDYDPDPRFEFGEAEIRFFDGDEEGVKKGLNYRYKSGYRLIKKKLEEKYIIKFYEWVKVSDIGPILYLKSSVTRKRDGKLLGEAISASNGLGWLNKFGSWGGVSGDRCPLGRDDNNFPRFRKAHYEILGNIFFASKMEAK